MMIPSQQRKAAFDVVVAVAETIRGLGEVPWGPLYAVLMGVMDLDEFEAMVRVLVENRLVSRGGNMLRWIGPTKGGAE